MEHQDTEFSNKVYNSYIKAFYTNSKKTNGATIFAFLIQLLKYQLHNLDYIALLFKRRDLAQHKHKYQLLLTNLRAWISAADDPSTPLDMIKYIHKHHQLIQNIPSAVALYNIVVKLITRQRANSEHIIIWNIMRNCDQNRVIGTWWIQRINRTIVSLANRKDIHNTIGSTCD
eukprot:368260_1